MFWKNSIAFLSGGVYILPNFHSLTVGAVVIILDAFAVDLQTFRVTRAVEI